MNLQFENAWMLYLLWLVPLLAAGWSWLDERHRKALNRLVAPHLRRRLAPADMQTRQTWQLILVTIGVLLLLLAGARPQWGEREQTVMSRGRDVVIAVDVSRSMLAPDVHPNRLGRAKADLIDLIRVLDGDRAAVLAFRKSPTVVCPFTTDYAFLKQAIDGLAPHSAPRGETDIGAAITKSLDLLDQDAFSHQAIVLVSDGEDLSGEAATEAAIAGERGIPIYTVGIGSRSGSKIPDPESQSGYLRDGADDAVSKLDDSTLLAVSEASAGGAYIPLGTASTASTTLGQLYRKRLASIEARALAETQRRRAVERFQWFLAPAILCLLGAAGMSRGRLALRRKAATVVLLALLCLPVSARAETNASPEQVQPPVEGTERKTGQAAAWEAQQLAKAGNHAAAAAQYEAAAQGVSRKLARLFLHNAAAAHYRAGNLDKAETLLTQLAASNSSRERPGALQALGGVLHDMADTTSVTNAASAREKSEILKRAGNAIREAVKQGAEETAATQDLASVLDRWSQARADAEQRDLDEQYGEMELPQLMDQLFREQRTIREQAYAQATNASSARVTQLETLAESQRELAKAWGPLHSKLTEAMSQQSSATNAQQAAAMSQFVEQTRTMAHNTAEMLRDLNPEATAASRQSEEATYQIWKPTASFENLLTEGLYRQTNAIAATAEAAANRPTDFQQLLYDQKEAAELTSLFRSRFEQAIPPEGNLQVATNVVDGIATVTTNGISAEARAEVLGLSELLEDAQKGCSEALGKRAFKAAADQQQECMDAARRIGELLPRPPPQEQQQDQQEQNDEQQQDEDQKQEPQQGDEQQANQQQQPQAGEQEQTEDEQDAAEEREQRDAETLLERALEREREYEELKRDRDRYIPMLPGQRDL